MNPFKVHIEKRDISQTIRVYVILDTPVGDKISYGQVVSGKLVFMQIDRYATPEPLLTFSYEDSGTAFLQALAEGLAFMGIVAEVDNSQRIAAQALADERQKEIDYLRGQVDKMVAAGISRIAQ